jgi:hypothetical protein
MKMPFQYERPDGLSLEIHGTTGSFSVTDPSGKQSIPVEYLLTYADFDPASQQDQILKYLSPVREIFELKDQNFDELLQRDLDDARISSELIPYLLSVSDNSLIRLFPPIVVTVLPLDVNTNHPGRYYPKVEIEELTGNDGGYPTQVIRSGPKDSQTFRLERPVVDQRIYPFADNVLRLNPSKVRLVIVDGQHRAMALIAIQRNLQADWSQTNREPYKDFYAHWTAQKLQTFDLKKVSLPIMLCFMPTLDDQSNIGIDLVNASRSIFLTLNQTARAVSESRNRLLNDADICSEYLRSVLTKIKDDTDDNAKSLKIWNIELDQTKDRVRVESSVAVSSVNHLYYMIEHLVLRDSEINGISDRSGTFANRTRLDLHHSRTGADQKILSAILNATNRNRYTTDIRDSLKDIFMEHYGLRVIRILSEIMPLANLEICFAELEKDLTKDRMHDLHEAMFGVGGMSSAIEEHVDKLKKRIGRNQDVGDVQVARQIIQKFESLNKAKKEKSEEVELKAARLGINSSIGIPDGDLLKEIVKWNNQWRTVAWQTALMSTFFETCETSSVPNPGAVDLDLELNGFIDCINSFFCPQTLQDLNNLSMLNRGSKPAKSIDSIMNNAGSNSSWREIFGRNFELNPAAFPKIRFIFLEIWKSESNLVEQNLVSLRNEARASTFKQLYNRNLEESALSLAQTVSNLSVSDKDKVFQQSFDQLSLLVEALSATKLNRNDMKNAI